MTNFRQLGLVQLQIGKTIQVQEILAGTQGLQGMSHAMVAGVGPPSWDHHVLFPAEAKSPKSQNPHVEQGRVWQYL